MNASSSKIDNVISLPSKPKSEKEIISSWKGDLSRPLVSIVCTTYNHIDFIENAINSLLNQVTDFAFEIIVHDDASTDGTTKVVERYAENYPRIIVPIIQTKNQLSQGKRPSKFTFPAARGKYIAMCEADDYWINTDKLMLQVNAMLKHPNIGISIHPTYRVDMQNNAVVEDFLKGNCEQVLSVEECVESRNQYAPTASYLFKTKEALSLPQWFFMSKDLPFGDYFIETIIGRNGLLYLPNIRSVYRRNVVGSYTNRTTRISDNALIERMKKVIKYTEELHDYYEIPSESILKRKENVILDYQIMAINRSSFNMLKNVNNFAKKTNIESSILNKYLLNNKLNFIIYLKGKNTFNKFKKKLKLFIKL